MSRQLQACNGGLLKEVTAAQPLVRPDIWAGFQVTDNDGIRYWVAVTPMPSFPAGEEET